MTGCTGPVDADAGMSMSVIRKSKGGVAGRAGAYGIGSTNRSTIVDALGKCSDTNQVDPIIGQNLVAVAAIVMDLITWGVVDRHGGRCRPLFW